MKNIKRVKSEIYLNLLFIILFFTSPLLAFNFTIQSTIYGTSFKDALVSNLAFKVTDSLYKGVGDYSLEQSNIYDNNYFNDGSLGKIALHSALGALSASLTNNNILSGALSAGINEAMSSLLYEDTSNMTQSQIQEYNNKRLLYSQLTGVAIGALINGEAGANTSYDIATSAELNNRQKHQLTKESKELGYDKLDTEVVQIDPLVDLLLDSGLYPGGGKLSSVKLTQNLSNTTSINTKNQIRELFNKDSNINGITIGNKTYLAEVIKIGPKGAKIFKGVSDNEVFKFFKKTAGVKDMPKVRVERLIKRDSKGNIVRDEKINIYSVETEQGKFTLRDNSSSLLPNGKPAKWTIEINDVKGIRNGAELKFE